jgi:hypothetical protein
MSFICPHCSYENLDPSTFCVYCGKKLPASGTSEQVVPSSPYGAGTPSSVSQPDEGQDKMLSTDKRAVYPASPTPPNTPHWGGMPTPPPPMSDIPAGTPNWGPIPTPHVLPPADLSTVPPAQQWASSPPPYPAAPMQHPGQQWVAPPAPSASFSQMGTTTLATLRRALAGYGTVITHHSWLVEEKQAQGETLASNVKEQLMQQHYIGAVPTVEKLHEGTKTQAEREFLRLQRGNVTEFIYVASADNALYISRATTIQPSLSYIRVGVATILLLVVLLGPAITSGILGGMSGIGTAAFFAVGFSLLYSAALFLLFSLLLLSIIAWLQEKDGIKYLRFNHLSDFQVDDVAMLELATDRAIRDVIQQAGIDPGQITRPARGYQPGQKIRLI